MKKDKMANQERGWYGPQGQTRHGEGAKLIDKKEVTARQGRYPLDDARPLRDRPIRTYISRLYYAKSDDWNNVALVTKKEVVFEVEVQADSAGTASGQAAQDYAKEANQAVGGNLGQRLFEGRALWISDIVPGGEGTKGKER